MLTLWGREPNGAIRPWCSQHKFCCSCYIIKPLKNDLFTSATSCIHQELTEIVHCSYLWSLHNSKTLWWNPAFRKFAIQLLRRVWPFYPTRFQLRKGLCPNSLCHFHIVPYTLTGTYNCMPGPLGRFLELLHRHLCRFETWLELPWSFQLSSQPESSFHLIEQLLIDNTGIFHHLFEQQETLWTHHWFQVIRHALMQALLISVQGGRQCPAFLHKKQTYQVFPNLCRSKLLLLHQTALWLGSAIWTVPYCPPW